MDYTFQKHALSEAERAWLLEASRLTPFDPRSAKVSLYGKLPEDFDPRRIDSRLYANGSPTAIALWYLDRESKLLSAMDQVIRTVRNMIFKTPGIKSISASSVAEQSGLDEGLVGRALYEISQLAHFFTSARGASDVPQAFESVELTDETAYDEYLRFKGLDSLLERFYIGRTPTRKESVDNVLSSYDGGMFEAKTLLHVDTVLVKAWAPEFSVMVFLRRQKDVRTESRWIVDHPKHPEYSYTSTRLSSIPSLLRKSSTL